MVCRRYSKVAPDVVKKIRTIIFKTNPATQREIANKLGVSQGTVYHVIKHNLKCRLRKKPIVHQLNQAQNENDVKDTGDCN